MDEETIMRKYDEAKKRGLDEETIMRKYDEAKKRGLYEDIANMMAGDTYVERVIQRTLKRRQQTDPVQFRPMYTSPCMYKCGATITDIREHRYVCKNCYGKHLDD
jgi:hypothetical protein